MDGRAYWQGNRLTGVRSSPDVLGVTQKYVYPPSCGKRAPRGFDQSMPVLLLLAGVVERDAEAAEPLGEGLGGVLGSTLTTPVGASVTILTPPELPCSRLIEPPGSIRSALTPSSSSSSLTRYGASLGGTCAAAATTGGPAVLSTTPSYMSHIFLPTKQTTRGRCARILVVRLYTFRRISRVDSSDCWRQLRRPTHISADL